MNAFEAIEIPNRTNKPRDKGITMVLDKGLGYYQALDLMEYAADYIDVIKLGWGIPRLISEDKIGKKVALYKAHNILVSNGGTLFEIAYRQKKMDEFFDCARKIGLNLIEISNGVVPISIKEKGKWIKKARAEKFEVFSEVGKKDPGEDVILTLKDRLDREGCAPQRGWCARVARCSVVIRYRLLPGERPAVRLLRPGADRFRIR